MGVDAYGRLSSALFYFQLFNVFFELDIEWLLK